MPSGCLIKRKLRKGPKPWIRLVNCKLPASPRGQLSALLEADSSFLGQHWLGSQSDLSGLHLLCFFFFLVAKELSSGEGRGEVTQLTRARLTFYSFIM